MKRLILPVVLAVLSFAALSVPAAVAGDTTCAGTVGATTIGAVTVDNVVVPPGAFCRLVGTQVRGNVKVLEGATFESWGANIHGDVQADKSFYTDLYIGSQVGGDVQIKNSAVDTDICGTEIHGDLQLEEIQGTLDAARIGQTFHPGFPSTSCASAPNAPVNRVIIHGNFQAYKNKRPVDLRGSQIDGNVQYFENFNGEINNNQIGGDLECEKNSPPPTGGGNTAQHKEGQCATF